MSEIIGGKDWLRVFEAIQSYSTSGLTPSDIASITDVEREVVEGLLGEMTRAGVVVSDGVAGSKIYGPQPLYFLNLGDKHVQALASACAQYTLYLMQRDGEEHNAFLGLR